MNYLPKNRLGALPVSVCEECNCKILLFSVGKRFNCNFLNITSTFQNNKDKYLFTWIFIRKCIQPKNFEMFKA